MTENDKTINNTDKLTIDEDAMKTIIDRLVDPWHKTFARDVVELYEKAKQQQHKHPDDYTACMTHADEALDGVVTRTKT